MSIEPKAIAIANNDYVHVAWDFSEPLAGCIGFSIHRMDDKGGREPLHAFGKNNPNTDESPISKYSWRDLLVPKDAVFHYEIIPMKDKGKPLPGVEHAVSNSVTVSENCGDCVKVFFNRGILSTQSTAHLIADRNGKPSRKILEDAIANPDSQIRHNLEGEMFNALTILLNRAKDEGGSCWASLYELTDTALIQKLVDCAELHLILSNNNSGSGSNIVYDGANQDAAELIGEAIQKHGKGELIRRFMPNGHIGHNKFMVYKDKHGTAKAVLTGSTNWTATGLCTQNNNCIIIESAALASLYTQYWEDLKKDAEDAGIPEDPAPMPAIQGAGFRKKDAKERKPLPLNDGSTVQVAYSPNSASVSTTTTPVDLQMVYDIMSSARQSVLFLAFQPGAAGSANSRHFLKELARISIKKPALFIRGAVSDGPLAAEFNAAVGETAANEDSTVVSPAGVLAAFGDEDHKWLEEMFRFGHAIVHDKVIVVDPLSDDCVVITGSHNLGTRASTNNDENMLIIRGDRAVAAAYAAHVMDVVEHYRFRFIATGQAHAAALKEVGGDPAELKKHPNVVKKHFNPAFHGQFIPTWQDRYFNPSRPAFAERLFWVSEGKPLAGLTDLKAVKKAAVKKTARKVAAKTSKKTAKKGAKKK